MDAQLFGDKSMHSISLSMAGPVIGSTFLASLVEFVEAFTIIMAVGSLRGWRPAAAGTLAALGVLAALALTLGPLAQGIPIQALQLTIGILLLLSGMGWLRKSTLRLAGIIPLHDEDAVFASASSKLAETSARHHRSIGWLAGLTAFKAVVLEGLEVVFIVVAMGTAQGMLLPAAVGACVACLAALAVGLAVRKPLANAPENTLKLLVGIMLSSFGIFWTGEGLGIDWPGHDFALPVFAIVFGGTAFATASVTCISTKMKSDPRRAGEIR